MATAVTTPRASYRPLHFSLEKTHVEHRRHRNRWLVRRDVQRDAMIRYLAEVTVRQRLVIAHLQRGIQMWRRLARPQPVANETDLPSQVVPFRSPPRQ